MATYATYSDVQERMIHTMSTDEQAVCTALLEDAGIIIDAYNADADEDIKLTVSVRMVSRAMANMDTGLPVGASQASMSALGYAQSWTMGAGSSTGELYLNKLEKKLLGVGNLIGSWSPVEELVEEDDE